MSKDHTDNSGFPASLAQLETIVLIKKLSKCIKFVEKCAEEDYWKACWGTAYQQWAQGQLDKARQLLYELKK